MYDPLGSFIARSDIDSPQFIKEVMEVPTNSTHHVRIRMAEHIALRSGVVGLTSSFQTVQSSICKMHVCRLHPLLALHGRSSLDLCL